MPQTTWVYAGAVQRFLPLRNSCAEEQPRDCRACVLGESVPASQIPDANVYSSHAGRGTQDSRHHRGARWEHAIGVALDVCSAGFGIWASIAFPWGVSCFVERTHGFRLCNGEVLSTDLDFAIVGDVIDGRILSTRGLLTSSFFVLGLGALTFFRHGGSYSVLRIVRICFLFLYVLVDCTCKNLDRVVGRF